MLLDVSAQYSTYWWESSVCIGPLVSSLCVPRGFSAAAFPTARRSWGVGFPSSTKSSNRVTAFGRLYIRAIVAWGYLPPFRFPTLSPTMPDQNVAPTTPLPRYGTVATSGDANQNGKRPAAALEWAPRKKP